MGDVAGQQDALHGCDPAAAAQGAIDDHQVGLASRRRRFGIGFVAGDRADVMAHADQQFRQVHGNQPVILDQHDPQSAAHDRTP